MLRKSLSLTYDTPIVVAPASVAPLQDNHPFVGAKGVK